MELTTNILYQLGLGLQDAQTQKLITMNPEQLIEELKKVISILERPLINSNDISLAVNNLKQIIYIEESISEIYMCLPQELEDLKNECELNSFESEYC